MGDTFDSKGGEQNIAQGKAAYRKVLALGEARQDKEKQAIALGNLGNVYQTRGELDKAEEMYRKALALNEALGSKEGMAADYGNLGIVYRLVLDEALGRKEGMAAKYGNLGNVYTQRGNLDQAEAAWKQSLSLYQEMGAMQHPCAKKVQQGLDELAQQRGGASR